MYFAQENNGMSNFVKGELWVTNEKVLCAEKLKNENEILREENIKLKSIIKELKRSILDMNITES